MVIAFEDFAGISLGAAEQFEEGRSDGSVGELDGLIGGRDMGEGFGDEAGVGLLGIGDLADGIEQDLRFEAADGVVGEVGRVGILEFARDRGKLIHSGIGDGAQELFKIIA